MRRTTRSLIAVTPIVAIVAACSGDTGSTPTTRLPDPVGLSFSVTQPGASADRLFDTGPGGHTLDLQQIQLVLARIRMRKVGEPEPGCAGPNETHPCTELKAGPVLVDLPVHGGLVTPISTDIPAGSYDRLLLNIFAPSGDDEASVAFRAANNWPKLAGMRVKGTYDGQAFDLFLNVNAEIFTRLDPVFVVTADKSSALNATVQVDPHTWFKQAGGTLIDPRALTADKSLLDFVTANVRQSFKAFSDNQRKGHT